MFTIIGGDGKEYGPASAEQLRSWIAAGRANLETQARAVGSEEWRRLGDYPEFGAGVPPVIGSPAAGVPLMAMTTGTQAELASRGVRFGAALINGFLCMVASAPGMMMMMMQVMRDNPDLASGGGITSAENLDLSGLTSGRLWMQAGLAVVTVIQGILLTFRGQDIGKMIAGARVVRVDGTPAGFLRAAGLRLFVPTLISLIPVIGFFFTLVDICFIFREDRRCVHDLMAGTKVVKA